MISFLSPLALAGGLLLAIPIVVHLFKPRKVRVTEFSSLRWLHLTQQRLARRIQWHQVLLFLLRAGFIALLVLALARPMFSPAGAGGLTERFIVIDVSRSMAYAPKDRPSPIESARQVAGRVLSQSVGDDRTAVLLAGRDTRVLAPLATDPEGHLAALRSVAATYDDGTLTSAFDVIRPMLADRRDAAGVEIVFITDNQQRAWDQIAVADFVRELGDDARNLRVRVIDTGVGGPQNAWIATAKLVDAGSGDSARRLIRVQASCVGDASQKRVLRLVGVAGQPERTQPLTLEPGRLASVDFELPESLDLRGQIAELQLDPEDNLASDDRWFLNLDPRGVLRVLVVEPEGNEPETLRPAFHLRTALAALKTSSERGIDIQTRTTGSLAARELATADVTVLCGVAELPEPAVAAIEARVAGGGGLAVFLGPDIRTDFYNSRLYRAATPERSLSPAPIVPAPGVQSAAGARRPEPTALAAIRWSSPILAPLQDPVFGDLAQARFTPNLRLDTTRLEAGKVLAWIGEAAPAVVEHTFGAGRVLFFNTTANDTWTDLPRKRSYVPLLDRVIGHLAGGNVSRSFEAGEAVTIPIPDRGTDDRIDIITPSKERIPARLRSLGTSSPGSHGASRAFLHVDTAREVGVYRVVKTTGVAAAARGTNEPPDGSDVPPVAAGEAGADVELMCFVVQAGRAEGVLGAIDGAMLQRWWSPVAFEAVTADAAERGAVSRFSRLPLWPWMVALGSLALLAEMYLVHRFCPQMNPNIVEPVVRRRGLAVTRPAGVTNSGTA